SLIGFDEARMVVAFHLEDGGVAVADVDDAGVLAWPLEHPWSLRWQRAKMHARGFVGAVLAPHHREDAELDETRLAVKEPFDASVFFVAEAMLANEGGGDFGQNTHPLREGRKIRGEATDFSGLGTLRVTIDASACPTPKFARSC